jgi:LysM repeat protein
MNTAVATNTTVSSTPASTGGTPSQPNGSTVANGSGGSTPSTPAGGTRVFGNLEGRDPDLIFAGEKILINGKEVIVKSGDTLSSLAAAHGTTVAKLIAENKMNASLLGQNGPNGAYFTPGGPQPANGGALAGAPNNTPQTFEPAPPAGPNGTYTKEQVATMSDQVQQLQKDGKITKAVADETLDLLNKSLSDPKNFSSEQKTRLETLLGEIKSKANGSSTGAAAGSTTAPTTPSSTSNPESSTPTAPTNPTTTPTNNNEPQPSSPLSPQGIYA